MLGIIGRKVGMTQIVDDSGKSAPCTVISCGPCSVTQIRTQEKDGYSAVQLGYEDKKDKHSNKPEEGHFKKAGVECKRKLIEFRDFAEKFDKELNLGDTIRLEDVFVENEFVDATGTSKGKGFQGVVKRHGFKGVGGQTHGQHNRQRSPGSIGGASYPSRVFKGIRMAGRTGGDRVTVSNLKILKIIPEHNVVVVKGAVPGAKNGYIVIRK